MDYSLAQIADMLDGAQRHGQWPDRKDGARLGTATATGAPVAAGSDRYIKLSDGLAREISAALRRLAKGESPGAVPLMHR